MLRNEKQTILPMLTFVLLAGLTLASPKLHALGLDGQWQPMENNGGVVLYRAVNESEGLLPFKAVAELAVPYEKIVMALVDAENKPNWAPKLKATAIHKEISSNQFEYSEYYETPWPYKDREFLLVGTVTYEHDHIVFSAANSKNRTLARRDHLTANIQELTFSITPLSDTRTRVAFTFSGDMGGWIPAFVKTIIQKRWPVLFIQALSDRVADNHSLETTRYQTLEKATLTFPES